MERILGHDMGEFVRALHEQHGVRFHLGATAIGVEGREVRLSNGTAIKADFIVAGLGVRPRVGLAEAAGLRVDRGVVVDAYCRDERAGNLRRWRCRPLARSDRRRGNSGRALGGRGTSGPGRRAQPHGRANAIRGGALFLEPALRHPINYVGHAERWDEIAVEGDIAAKDCLVRYKSGGRTLAVASIFRDTQSLEAEVNFERRRLT